MSADLTWDPAAAAAFYDAYGEQEWTRFHDGRTPTSSLATHVAQLERFVRAGDRVLDIGCGPGRFTIELARLGARVVAADISPGQLALHERFVGEADADAAVEQRLVCDVLDLSAFPDRSFDRTVCFGGALSYVLDQAPRGAAELARVTRPGGHVLVSVMSLVGTVVGALRSGWLAGRGYSNAEIEAVVLAGLLPASASGHPAMKLYRASELHALLARHGAVVAVAATGLFEGESPLLERLELDLGAEPGAVDIGPHILAVLEVA